jgi:hypothetical protein
MRYTNPVWLCFVLVEINKKSNLHENSLKNLIFGKFLFSLSPKHVARDKRDRVYTVVGQMPPML